MNGIFFRKDIKLVNWQELWNLGVRFIYADATKNSLLLDSANACAYQGFKLGLYHRLRYPPEEGSADSQAQEFARQESAMMNLSTYKDVKFLTPVLLLEKGGPALCETNFYRGMIMTFLQKYRSYHGESENFYLRMTDEMIAWMHPTQAIVDAFKLWIHEPTKVLVYSPWKSYVYRSYAARSMAGNMAEPVDEWVVPPVPPVPPVVVKLNAQQQLDAIAKIIADNK
jgi:hypothetical protein